MEICLVELQLPLSNQPPYRMLEAQNKIHISNRAFPPSFMMILWWYDRDFIPQDSLFPNRWLQSYYM